MSRRTSVYLHGFRATGKSTIAPLVGALLGWQVTDMDEEIVRLAGATIPQLTANGTSWGSFRRIEHDLLLDLLPRAGIVVSTSGGLAVNDVVVPGTGQTFGNLNSANFRRFPQVLSILLIAADDVIESRLRRQGAGLGDRPFLDESRAGEIRRSFATSPSGSGESLGPLTDAAVDDSMAAYRARRPLYSAIADMTIDTGTTPPGIAASLIAGAVRTAGGLPE